VYYVYIILSLVGDLVITMEHRLLETFEDLWVPMFIYPLIFAGFVLLHVIVVAFISLFADKNKRWIKLDNIYRRLTLETIDLYLHIMRSKIHIKGEEKLPEGKRFFFVGNHRSIFDPMIAMLSFKELDLAFVSKKENIEIPFGGRLMLASGCIPLDRDNNRSAVKSIKEASSRISEDISSIGIYPEGGINKTEELLLPFHSGSFKIATKTGAPIVIAAVRNSDTLCRRFLFTSTDVYLDIIRVIQPEEYRGMTTQELSNTVWNEMYVFLSGKNYISPVTEGDTEDRKAAC